jgi:transposase
MRTTFSPIEVAELKKNPCVYDCTAKSVYYTYEFKKRALDLHASGIRPREIWKQAGFNVAAWKKEYFGLTLRDWKRIMQKDGVAGLKKTGGLPYDRGPKHTRDDELKRLRLEVAYLKEENRFLAKLRAKKAE